MTSTPYRLRFRSWLVAHAGVALTVFAAATLLFAIAAHRLDNRFAESARSDYLGVVLRVKLGLLPAYFLIALGHAWLSYAPARRRFETRGRRLGMAWRPRRRRVLGLAFLWSFAIFALSMGPMTYLGPGSLDNLARISTRVISPSFNVYLFETWRLKELFTLILSGLALFAFVESAAALVRLVRGRSPRMQAASGLVIGMIAAGAFIWMKDSYGASPPRDVDRPNILVIASDSLRRDHLGFAGYRRPGVEGSISPNIDRIAAESIDFEQMHVATASTLESWASFMTGLWPANHGLRYMFATREQVERVDRNEATLPRMLRGMGYRSAVVGDWAANCFSLVDFGFDVTATSDVQNLQVFLSEVAFRTHVLVTHYFSNSLGEAIVPEMSQVTGYMNPGHLTNRMQREFAVSAARGEPFFGLLFLSCTHLPFATTKPYNSMYGDADYRGPNRFQIHFNVDDFIKNGFDREVPEEEKRQIVALYDGGVTMFDDVVGGMMRWLEERGLDRNTIVVVTSDHGEDLYEPGTTLGHGTNFFGGDQSTRIPFLLRLPGGQLGGRRVPGVTRNVDFMATMLDLARSGAAEGREEGSSSPVPGDGVSLAPLIAEPDEDPGLAAFAETCYLFYPKRVPDEDVHFLKPADETLRIDPDFRHLFVLESRYHDDVIETKDRMMRTNRWKLIHIKGRRGPIWRFYDMRNDPHQTLDLSRADLPFAPLGAMKEALLHWMATGEAKRWPASWDDLR